MQFTDRRVFSAKSEDSAQICGSKIDQRVPIRHNNGSGAPALVVFFWAEHRAPATEKAGYPETAGETTAPSGRGSVSTESDARNRAATKRSGSLAHRAANPLKAGCGQDWLPYFPIPGIGFQFFRVAAIGLATT